MNMIREQAVPIAETARDLQDMCVDAICRMEDLEHLIWAAKEQIADAGCSPATNDRELLNRAAGLLRCCLIVSDNLSELLNQIEVATHGRKNR